MGDTYIDKYAYNIEGAQKLIMQWSPEIVWDYSNGYPKGTESVFNWSSDFIPYKEVNGNYEVFHVWMRYKIGEKGAYSMASRINYPEVVEGEKGDTGEKGERGYRGLRGVKGDSISVQYADPYFNIVPGTSNSAVYIRVSSDSGSTWSTWFKMVGADGVGVGGTGLPAGGTVDQLIARTALGYTWIDQSVVYKDADAVAAMGALADSNPLNHTKYTDAEATIMADASIVAYNAGLLATSPIAYNNGTFTFSHVNTDGNKHVPVGGNSGDALTTDGAGNYSWVNVLEDAQLDDLATSGTTKLYSVTKILSLINNVDLFGIKYYKAAISDLGAITGMQAGYLAAVEEDRYIYKYDGSNWAQWFELDGAHNHNSLYYTQTQLDGGQLDTLYYTETELDAGQLDNRYYTETELGASNAGAVAVHWDNLTHVPTFLTLANISATSPILYNNTTGVISHATSAGSSVAAVDNTFINAITLDSFGHSTGIATKVGTTVTFDSGSFILTDASDDSDIATGLFKPIDFTYAAENLNLNFNSGTLDGVSAKPARYDHKHSSVKQILKVADKITSKDQVITIEDGIITSITEGTAALALSFSSNPVTIERQQNGTVTATLSGGAGTETFDITGFALAGISITTLPGAYGTNNLTISTTSSAALGDNVINFEDGSANSLGSLTVHIDAESASSAVGSFSVGSVSGSSGSTATSAASTSFTAGTSETYYTLVRTTGTAELINNSTSAVITSSDHFTSAMVLDVHYLDDPGNSSTFEMRANGSRVLDTLTVTST